MTPLRLPPDSRVLVVVLRRLGDVLLATPLIRSIKRAFPASSVDALVFAGTEGILARNPDLADIITMPRRSSAGENAALLLRLWRRYDIAFSAQTGDRPTTWAWIAGRRCAGPVEAVGFPAALKRLVLSRCYVTDPERHRVLDVLRLTEAIGIPALAEVVGPPGERRLQAAPAQAYAVVHAAPSFTYKRWRAEGWRALATSLRERGLVTVITGAPGDRGYLDEIWHDRNVVRLDGRLDWPELSALIGNSEIYLGPDTAVTHLAASTGVPTIALYGPTDPRIWGPWPRGGLDQAWNAAGTIQRRGSVWLVQNPLSCLPCQQEGCERRLDSHSRCLDELPLASVMAAVDQALAVQKVA